MSKGRGEARPESYGGAPQRSEPSLSIRIEYVGVIAMACLALGLIIGSTYFGGGRAGSRATVEELIAEGNAAFDAHNRQAAIEAYEKALEMDPHNPDVLTDTGTMYLELGNTQKAIEYFQRAANESPEHANSRYNLAIAFMSAKRYGEAAMAFREYLRISPNDDRAKVAKAHLDIIEKKHRKP
ncbi:MAG: tetratricopeptide repeat protein [Armatimonadota bacterium]|nr:tetratricopeptide repeat protein [Armatimonadota bacterium]